MATRGPDQFGHVFDGKNPWDSALREAFELGESSSVASRDRAISIYRDVTGRDPNCGVAWFNLGVLESRSRSIDAAIGSFEHAQRFPDFRAGAAFAMRNL